MSLFFSSCNVQPTTEDSNAISADTTNNTNTTDDSTFSFSGIISTTISDTTIILNWTNDNSLTEYNIYNIVSGTPTLIATKFPPSSSYLITGLTPGATYVYSVTAKNSSNEFNDNVTNTSITLNTSPTPPSGLTLSTPATSPSSNETIDIIVSGVKSGDTIELYSESTCNTLNKISSGVSTGSSITLTTSSLAIGSHNIYATAKGVFTSSCSTANLSYTRILVCPTNYIPVPGNSELGVNSDFCVMKYEAKDDGNGNAVSTPDNTPWVSINIADAKTECQNLNTLNGTNNKYDLLSNPEWMTIARNAELVDANWTSGSVGTGAMFIGNAGSTGYGNNGYNGPDPDFGNSRTGAETAQITLDNGEVIWDFAGNIWEFVDWTLGGTLGTITLADKPYLAVDGGPISAWRNLIDVDVFPISTPSNMLVSSSLYSGISSGTGTYVSGTDGNGVVIRGGTYNTGGGGGMFTTKMNLYSSSVAGNIGLRCVYRP